MEKRLVKTAKQQFEERLKLLCLVKKWELCKTEIYYHCMDADHDFHILREQDGEYKELCFHHQYEALVLSEAFLFSITERFVEGKAEIKQLYNWYASADHDEEPFTLMDIYMCGLEDEEITFEDIYEEVPDEDPYANTRTQAHKEIEDKGMRMEYESDNGKYYAAEADGKFQVICIWNEGHPTKYTFGESRKKLCESVAFRNAMLMYLALDRDQEEVSKFAAWIKDSTKPEPFDVYDIIEALHFAEGMAISEVYEVNSKIEIDMSPVDEVRNRLIEAIRSKYERGYVVDVMKVRLDTSVAYTDGSGSCLEGYDVGIYEGIGGKLGIEFNGTDEWKDMKKMQRLKYEETEGDLDQVCVEHLYEILQAMVLPK